MQGWGALAMHGHLGTRLAVAWLVLLHPTASARRAAEQYSLGATYSTSLASNRQACRPMQTKLQVGACETGVGKGGTCRSAGVQAGSDWGLQPNVCEEQTGLRLVGN